MRIRINPESSQRFKTFLKSDYYTCGSLYTEHWATKDKANIDNFKVGKNGDIDIRLNNPGLDLSYEHNFNHKKKFRLNDSIGLIDTFRNRLINLLGSYEGMGYNPRHHFKKKWIVDNKYAKIEDLHDLNNSNNHTHINACLFFKEIYNVATQLDMDFKNILEIGPGSANLIYLLKKKYINTKFYIIDIPSSMPYSFCNLLHKFPDATFLLPNEQTKEDKKNIDFVFVTNEQTDLIPKNTFDLAINTMSFGEMKFDNIKLYFELLRHSLKINNIFYCVNRVEKWMTYNEKTHPIRFHDYPYCPEDFDYKYKISRIEMGRTYQPFYERIAKLKVNHGES